MYPLLEDTQRHDIYLQRLVNQFKNALREYGGRAGYP